MTLACLGLCLVAPAVAWADDVPQKTVRLGYVNVEGYEEGGPDEPKQGFGYEYFQKISYYANWDYEYVYGTFSDLIHMLERGEIDVLGDVTRSEEREGKMLFSQLPMGDEKFYLYCRADDERFHSSSIEQMKGVRIGVEGKKASAKLARDWAKTHNPSAVFVDCADSKVLNDSLDDGRVDLIVLTDFAEGFGYQPVQLLGNQDIYFAVTKSRPDLLNELNDALSVIQTSSPNYNATAKSRYVDGSVSSYLLGTREKKWLQDHGNHVTVGYLDDNLPYSDLDRAGYLQGYLSTMVEAMREEHGIDVDTVPFQNIKDMYQSFRKGEIDVYGPCYGSFYTSEFYGVMQTDRVAETQAAIIYSGSEPNTERIAVTNRSMLFDHMLSQRYPEAQIVLCDDVRACIHAVSSGQADCTFVPASQMSRMRLYHEFQSLNYVVTNLNLSMFFFVRQGNPGLLQIMDKCVVLVNRQQEGISYLPNSYADQEIALLDIIENNMGVVVAFVLVVAGV
ncbi:MAG: transporter substrate-binding domain-containing protein, partial [Coriobacteriia bacterium]|nr:transporter substrate-binding domain-containing protein [Coriobacteriia bacterium]